MSTMTTYRFEIGRGDDGHRAPPGGGISEYSVTVYATGTGRYAAVAEVKTGTNQGYDRWDYEYGPWEGRGRTVADAVAQCLQRADPEYADRLRRAAIDAANQAADAAGYAALAGAEADRIQAVLDRGEAAGCRSAVVAGTRQYAASREARDAIRRDAVAALRRIASRGASPRDTSPLASASDADLLAEVRRRGLII